MSTSDTLFTYDPLKAYESFKWKNNVEAQNVNLVQIYALKEELIKMTFDLKAKSMYTVKGIGY